MKRIFKNRFVMATAGTIAIIIGASLMDAIDLTPAILFYVIDNSLSKSV